MAALDDLADTLDTAAVVGGATGWEVHLGIMPEDDDLVVAIFEEAGEAPDTQAEDVNQYDYPRFELYVRATTLDYETAHTKAQEAFDALHDATIAGWNYIYATGTPFLRGYDRSNRPVLQVNFHSMRIRTA